MNNQSINVENVENQSIGVENKQTITKIVEQVGKSPYVGENGNWFEYIDSENKFIDTGVSATGEQGIPGLPGNNATINGLETINIHGGDNISLVQQGSDFYINYNGTQMSAEVVETLPEVGIDNKIYLVLKENGENNDIYNEFLYINGIWENIGNTQMNLSDYPTRDEVVSMIEEIPVNGSINISSVYIGYNNISALSSDPNILATYGKEGIFYVYGSNGSFEGLLMNSHSKSSGSTIQKLIAIGTYTSYAILTRSITSATKSVTFTYKSDYIAKDTVAVNSAWGADIAPVNSKAITKYVGLLTNLKTTTQSSIVSAINELKTSIDTINETLSGLTGGDTTE